MFTILKRLSPIVLDCFTYRNSFLKFHYPRSSYDYLKNEQQTRHNDFVIPLWCDVSINLNHISKDHSIGWKFADEDTAADIHPYIQFRGFMTEKKLQQLKIPVPWVIKEKTGVKFLASSPQWALKDLQRVITPLPGMVDFKYQHSANIQYLFNYPQVETVDSVIIPAGMPLYQFFPLSDRKVKIKTHLISREEFWDYHAAEKFSNHYSFRKKSIDKCPFH